jgi:hypothetical protein
MKASQIGVKVLQNAAVANGDGALYSLAGSEHIVICISGTFSASIHLEASIDGTVWHEVAAHDLTSTSANDKAKTINSPGIYALEHVGGMTLFRARISGYSSGAVTVRANAHG